MHTICAEPLGANNIVFFRNICDFYSGKRGAILLNRMISVKNVLPKQPLHFKLQTNCIGNITPWVAIYNWMARILKELAPNCHFYWHLFSQQLFDNCTCNIGCHCLYFEVHNHWICTHKFSLIVQRCYYLSNFFRARTFAGKYDTTVSPIKKLMRKKEQKEEKSVMLFMWRLIKLFRIVWYCAYLRAKIIHYIFEW